MLVVENSMLLGIKFFSFFLENFYTYSLMFINTIRIKFSTTSSTAKNQLRWIILYNLHFILFVDYFYGFILKLIFIAVISRVIRWFLSWWLLLSCILWPIILKLFLNSTTQLFFNHIIIFFRLVGLIFCRTTTRIFNWRLVVISVLVL